MNTAATLALLLTVATVARGQVFPTAATAARSVSGQFIVLAPQPLNPDRPVAAVTNNANWIRLEPTWLAISAERIEQAVWHELGVTGQWHQKITLLLFRARTADETVTIISSRSLGGWTCRVEMPDQLSRERYMRALVQVVLLEIANRSVGEHPAEIPAWLVEGIAYELLANHSSEVVITPPRYNAGGIAYTSLLTDAMRVSPLETAHKTLLGATPLTFEELSWPAPGQIEGPAGPSYRASAQLLTAKLLALPNGTACMRAFLAALPSHLNWQIAFLDAFQSHFRHSLDVEKWWALQAAEFSGRDVIQTWPYEESWGKLASTLQQAVDVFTRTNELPIRSEVNLQTVVRDWNPADQAGVLRGKAGELEALRLRIAPELIALTVEYRNTIETYLKQLPPTGGRGKAASNRTAPKRAQNDAIQRLDDLDAQLDQLRPKPTTAGAVDAPRQ